MNQISTHRQLAIISENPPMRRRWRNLDREIKRTVLEKIENQEPNLKLLTKTIRSVKYYIRKAGEGEN